MTEYYVVLVNKDISLRHRYLAPIHMIWSSLYYVPNFKTYSSIPDLKLKIWYCLIKIFQCLAYANYEKPLAADKDAITVLFFHSSRSVLYL